MVILTMSFSLGTMLALRAAFAHPPRIAG